MECGRLAVFFYFLKLDLFVNLLSKTNLALFFGGVQQCLMLVPVVPGIHIFGVASPLDAILSLSLCSDKLLIVPLAPVGITAIPGEDLPDIGFPN